MKHYFTRFEEAVKNNWERPALANFRGESFTFGEFATQIARFHVFFEAIGLKKGDKVALCAKNSAVGVLHSSLPIHTRRCWFLFLRIFIRTALILW